jgi:hypothetical protein
MAMRQKTVQCLSPTGLHDMAYVEWGDPRTASCWSACTA